MSLIEPRNGIAGAPELVRKEIDDFEVSIGRFRAGLVPEMVFLEHRLRQGVYGQRQDGVHMLRSKLPLGLLSPDQMEAFADIAELFGHGVAHLTTRQDIQVHFVELEDTPALMRVLSTARMTSKEACGNVVRNVTASDVAGVDPAEAFDVTPHGMALATYLLRLPDGQSLGRKFKATLSSSFDPRFNLDAIHDLAATARIEGGRRGFRIRVGGGLGAVPHEAALLYDFLPEEELLPVAHAIVRVFSEHGEKKNRARARMKFVVAKLGIEAFRGAVELERARLPHDPRWTAHLPVLDAWSDRPLFPPGERLPEPRTPGEARWMRTNVLPQKQPGYASVKVRVPRGDLSPEQLRALADVVRANVGDTTRIGADQSLRIRWVSYDKVADLYDALDALGLAEPNAGGLADPITCPGADTCKLGITSPRAVARQMQEVLDELAGNPRLEALRIHISGCPNACAQHQIGDIGFFGAARTIGGQTSPHYMLLLGGLLAGDAPEGGKPGDGFGQVVTKVPAWRVGDAVRALCELYVAEAADGEPFGLFTRRVGRPRLKELLAPIEEIPPYEVAPHLYREFGKEAEAFEIKRGKGECAGEIVDLADLLMAEADLEADQAVALYDGSAAGGEVALRSRRAFELAARALLSMDGLTNPTEFVTVDAFRANFYEKGRIFEGVGHYFLQAASEGDVSGDRLRRLVVEAGLFVEEAHTILARVRGESQAEAR